MAGPRATAEEIRVAHKVYREALGLLLETGPPFLVGGAYALAHYTGIERFTKDLDVFIRREDVDRFLDQLGGAGFRTERTFKHWLAKAYGGDDFLDLIYSSGNGMAPVDDGWFEHGVAGEVLGHRVKLVPPEEMIWSKALIQERERFDGADVAHLLRATAETLDWPRLALRFGAHWRVLYSHLVLFGFIYPGERTRVPGWVMRELTDRLRNEEERSAPGTMLCQGTFLSREQYLEDIQRRGFKDARLEPTGQMSEKDIEHWTAAINKIP